MLNYLHPRTCLSNNLRICVHPRFASDGIRTAPAGPPHFSHSHPVSSIPKPKTFASIRAHSRLNTNVYEF